MNTVSKNFTPEEKCYSAKHKWFNIVFRVPSEKELVGKLKDLGELNRYFAAVTPEEAPKFANLLLRVKPTENKEKPFPIIWGGYLSSVESRKGVRITQFNRHVRQHRHG